MENESEKRKTKRRFHEEPFLWKSRYFKMQNVLRATLWRFS
jgi:hypothetical protein